jgi:hypothetical protein
MCLQSERGHGILETDKQSNTSGTLVNSGTRRTGEYQEWGMQCAVATPVLHLVEKAFPARAP